MSTFYQLKCWYIVSQCIEMEFLNRANVYNLNGAERWKHSAISVCCGWNLSIFFFYHHIYWKGWKCYQTKAPASVVKSKMNGNNNGFYLWTEWRALEQDKWLVGGWKAAIVANQIPFLISFRNKIKLSDVEGITQIEKWWSSYNYWATRKE